LRVESKFSFSLIDVGGIERTLTIVGMRSTQTTLCTGKILVMHEGEDVLAIRSDDAELQA